MANRIASGIIALALAAFMVSQFVIDLWTGGDSSWLLF